MGCYEATQNLHGEPSVGRGMKCSFLPKAGEFQYSSHMPFSLQTFFRHNLCYGFFLLQHCWFCFWLCVWVCLFFGFLQKYRVQKLKNNHLRFLTLSHGYLSNYQLPVKQLVVLKFHATGCLMFCKLNVKYFGGNSFWFLINHSGYSVMQVTLSVNFIVYSKLAKLLIIGIKNQL